MKNLRILCLLIATLGTTMVTSAASPMATSTSAVLTGEVLETKDAAGYTYLRLKTKDGETWAAVSQTVVKKGAKVTLENTSVMNNFESKTLKQTFPSIVFGSLAGAGAATAAASPHTGSAKLADTGPIKVAKATGANAYTVAEVVTKATALKDKPVQVSGKVVKFNAGIMGKNWVHLRDGSGQDANQSNDILVTTAAQAKVGEVVTVAGVVRNDKDFGSGYTYKVMIEDATLKAANK
jgi:hypothetical protein